MLTLYIVGTYLYKYTGIWYKYTGTKQIINKTKRIFFQNLFLISKIKTIFAENNYKPWQATQTTASEYGYLR